MQLGIAGSEDGFENGPLLLALENAVEGGASERQAERRGGGVPGFFRGQKWQQIRDDVATFQPAERACRHRGQLPAQRPEQHVEIGAGGGAIVLDRQNDGKGGLSCAGLRADLMCVCRRGADAEEQADRDVTGPLDRSHHEIPHEPSVLSVFSVVLPPSTGVLQHLRSQVHRVGDLDVGYLAVG